MVNDKPVNVISEMDHAFLIYSTTKWAFLEAPRGGGGV